MTPTWKQRVRDRLVENEKNDVFPRNDAELARACNLRKNGKSTIGKLLGPNRVSSHLVDRICDVLKIELPLVESSAEDHLAEVIRSIPPDKRDDAARILEMALGLSR